MTLSTPLLEDCRAAGCTGRHVGIVAVPMPEGEILKAVIFPNGEAVVLFDQEQFLLLPGKVEWARKGAHMLRVAAGRLEILAKAEHLPIVDFSSEEGGVN